MLVTMKELVDKAKAEKYAVGAFNAPNFESLTAVIEAAEEVQKPVIIQHAEVHQSLIPIDVIGPMMLDAAKKASVPVCVHLDHGSSFDVCMTAIRLGFTSVMFDASTQPFEDNLNQTREIVKIAHSVGVSVEAELGHMMNSEVGGGEGRSTQAMKPEDCYTDPEKAGEFVQETGVDALAISFGTTHGVYLTEPVLDLNRVTQISEKTGRPLVMHGGSGVSDEDFRAAIKNGISKINYYTYMSMAGANGVTEHIKAQGPDAKLFFHDFALAAKAAMKEDVKKAIQVFQG